MAIGRPSISSCLFCQCRQRVIGRRRAATLSPRRFETQPPPSTLESDYFLSSGLKNELKALPPPIDVTPKASPVGDARLNAQDQDARLSFQVICGSRDQRVKLLLRLGKPAPPTYEPHSAPRHSHFDVRRAEVDKAFALPLNRVPGSRPALLPQAQFRALLFNPRFDEKTVRRAMRAQLLLCTRPREIYSVMAVVLQKEHTTKHFAAIWEPVIRALYRCRANVTDPEVLNTLTAIIARLRLAGVEVPEILYCLGLKLAARSRSLRAMKRYLYHIRRLGIFVGADLFRSVIAKCSIGSRGLGEIRNGRWKRSDLLQAMKGFDDCKRLPPEEQYHFGAFLDRSNWQYLHGWVAVLSRCRDTDGVWREWEIWRVAPGRTKPRNLQNLKITTRTRGDTWFVEQMAMAGDSERAWKILEESGMAFLEVSWRVKMRLLDHPEFCGAHMWATGGVREAMIQKYELELSKLERMFGVEWKPSPSADGDGMHELVEDQEDVLERLGADDWTMEKDYGFPYGDSDGGSVLPGVDDRRLHQAEEGGLAGPDQNG